MKINQSTIMRFSFLLLFSFTSILFINCSTERNRDFPISFDQKYFCQLGEGSKYFNSELSNTIVFYKDGTYSRTEVCGLFGTVYFHVHDFGGVFIDQMNGIWEYRNGELFLSDKEIVDFYCLRNDGEKVRNCIIEKDQIPFGLSEWFRSSKVWKITDESLFVEHQKSNH